jgi:hypothetical protein
MTNTNPLDLNENLFVKNTQPTSSICLRQDPEDIIRIDEEGFHYRGQFIADAGEAHRLMVEFLRKNTQPEPTLTVEDCNNMRKHAGNYIAEDFGGITLDGHFTREDLIEIANTVPRTEA